MKKTADMSSELLQRLQSSIDSMSVEEAMLEVKEAQNYMNKLKEEQETAKREVEAAANAVEIVKSKREGPMDAYGDKEYWESRYNKSSTSHGKDNEVYEWYVSLKEIAKELLADIAGNNKKSLRKASILVSGCGDSSSCEDLVDMGFTDVSGMDYSLAVIEKMRKRTYGAETRCIRYFQADALHMPSESSGKYDVVIDKGTLDAITSEQGGYNASKAIDIGYYKAVDYMREVWRLLSNGGQYIVVTTMPSDIFASVAIDPLGKDCSDWNSSESKRITLKTHAGNDVFYYVVTKRSMHSKELIFDGIKSLLDEAISAKGDFLDSINRENDEKLMETDVGRNFSYEIVTTPINDTETPHVTMVINNETSSFVACGQIDVSYSLLALNDESTSPWSDRDIICLVCACKISHDSSHNYDYYSLNDDSPYECFEYTIAPKKLSCGSLVGNLCINLPSYGGGFSLVYYRVKQITSGVNTCFRRYDLCRTEPFSIRSPIQRTLPDILNLHSTYFSKRRRGIGSMVRSEQKFSFTTIVEDLVNIQAINIRIFSPLPDTNKINRVMAWTYKIAEKIEVVVEFDIITFEDGDGTKRLKTKSINYVTLEINGNIFYEDIESNLLIASCSADLEGSKVSIRLPYRISDTTSSYACQPCKSDVDMRFGVNCNFNVSCTFCKAILSDMFINSIKKLPTGIFDNMMHDFICCEDVPMQAMASAEIVSEVATIIVGQIHIVLNPSQFRADSLRLSCKRYPSLLDMITGFGGLIATSSAINNNANSLVVDIDTCRLSCSRCGIYLGDGQFKSSQNENDTNCNEDFCISDLRDVRLCLHNINITANLPISHLKLKLSTEQIICRSLLHMYDAYGISTVLLQSKMSEELNIKIIMVSKDYRFNIRDTNAHSTETSEYLSEAIKVTFCFLDSSKGEKSTTQLNLEYHDLIQVIFSLYDFSLKNI